jgi:UDP-2-acetamido-3-amino-2,3-dideoxy-glucuronate N-acetyltransferase
VASTREIGSDVDIGPNAVIGDRVWLGDGVSIGPNAVLGDDVLLGHGAVVEAGAVVGKIARLAAHSRHPRVGAGPVRIGDGAVVCTHAVVYVDVTIGAGSIAGDNSVLREGTRMGEQSVVGRSCGTAPGVHIGSRVRVQAGSGLAPDSVIEDDVFIGPGFISLDDDTAGHWQSSEQGPRGVILRRGCRIGGGVTVMPGVEIGEDALVAAGSLVTGDVAAHSLVMGRPARFARELRAADGQRA